MSKKYTYILLGCIALLAGVLRLYALGVYPAGLTWDEVAWGYNAYAIGIDGRDEFGRFLPIDYLESFGDFKPPVYAYLTVIPVWVFGLTAFATRFPSALFGTFTVGITYWLVKEILGKKYSHRTVIALIATFLLAISPWHINLSRAAFEANVASFFIVLGVLFFLKWTHSSRLSGIVLLVSGVSFVLSLYTFNTSRIVAPLLIVILGISYWRILVMRWKEVVFVSIICFLCAFPVLQFMSTPQAQLRYHEVNIFSDIQIIEQANRYMARAAQWTCEQGNGKLCQEKTANDSPLWARMIYNRRWGYTRSFLMHYFDHFNPAFLFIRGDGNPKFSTQDVGQLYIISAPFLVLGIVMLIRTRRKKWWLVPLWLLVSIIPAATARETPHALRIEVALPTFQIFIAIGIVAAYEYVAKIWYGRMFYISMLALMYSMSLLYYLHGYYTHYQYEYSGEWQYGYAEAIKFAEAHTEYEQIVFTEGLGRPYAYVLFYAAIDPALFRTSAVVEREAFGFVHVRSVGRYIFSDAMSDIKQRSQKILYIDLAARVPDSATRVGEFHLLDGSETLVAYE